MMYWFGVHTNRQKGGTSFESSERLTPTSSGLSFGLLIGLLNGLLLGLINAIRFLARLSLCLHMVGYSMDYQSGACWVLGRIISIELLFGCMEGLSSGC